MEVAAGYVWINEVGKHFLGAPFGGVKQSGTGREECFEEILRFTQEKNLHVRLRSAPRDHDSPRRPTTVLGNARYGQMRIRPDARSPVNRLERWPPRRHRSRTGRLARCRLTASKACLRRGRSPSSGRARASARSGAPCCAT